MYLFKISRLDNQVGGGEFGGIKGGKMRVSKSKLVLLPSIVSMIPSIVSDSINDEHLLTSVSFLTYLLTYLLTIVGCDTTGLGGVVASSCRMTTSTNQI